MRTFLRAALLALALVFPGGALAAVQAGQPFPNNRYTTFDSTQATFLRVNLPQPNCATNPTDCADVAVLNQLDGFNIQPRISVPFSGPIDPATATSSTIFLIGPGLHKVGINQVVWEPAANTLHFESDEQLKPHSTYLLVVTRGVHDASGRPVAGLSLSRESGEERASAPMALAGGGPFGIAAVSVFTTQSIDAISKKIRAQLHATPVSFTLGMGGERTVFPLATVAAIQIHRQVGTAPTFSNSFLGTPVLGGVGTIAFGSYASPDYETAAKVIPAVGTRTGTPVPQGTNQIQFTLFVPAGIAPAGGWPVAIFGHGFTDSKNGAPVAVAGKLAQNGIATIAINVVGHGGGALGTYTVFRAAGPVTLPNGGRGIDQDGNGTIDSTEGVSAVGTDALIGNRDGLRQTVVDLMQLVKELQAGIDVDGDGTPDLSTSRIYYAGQSFGGIYGTQLLGLEPDIRAGVPNVAGGPIIEIARLSPSFRGLVGFSLATRVPSLYNNSPVDFVNFRENIPLRNLPPVTDTVPGASAIQTVIDNTEWAQQAANPAAYAPLITKPVIFQFARGDQTVPNPTTAAILRACACANRATVFRNDQARAAIPALSANPHTFLTNIIGPGAPFALAAQQQIATFFTSDGATTMNPGLYFETPTSQIWEDTGF